MKKMLVLGSSFSTSEIVRKSRQRGWYTIVTDNLLLEESSAKQAADEYWMISTMDTGVIEEKCRAEGIDAIFAGISEFNLDKVLTLTQALGLPCYIDAGAWKYARNKRLFKRKCLEKGIPVVREYPVSSMESDADWEKIEYPVVVKPVDGTGNAGLTICHNRQELAAGIRKARAQSANPEIIIEKYITGEETWNYYTIADGAIRYTYSGRAFKQPGYPTFLYSFCTTAPAGIDDYLVRMNPRCVELLKEIGCRDGVAWVQCIRDADGNYYALEMAHRMSADASGDMLEKGLGFNNVGWMLDTAMGVRHTPDMLPKQIVRPYPGAVCVYFLFADHAGTIAAINGLDRLDPARFQVERVRNTGHSVAQYNMMMKITFCARSVKEMCSTLQYLNREIQVSDALGKDLVVRFMDYDAVLREHQGLMQE